MHLELDWDKYEYFGNSQAERDRILPTDAAVWAGNLGKGGMDAIRDNLDEALEFMNGVRKEFGSPIIIASGLRHPDHPAEQHDRRSIGYHRTGSALDVVPKNRDFLGLLKIILSMADMDNLGLGYNPPHFIHVDHGGYLAQYGGRLSIRPATWTY